MVTDIRKDRFSFQIKLLRLAGISLQEQDSAWFKLYTAIAFAAILSLSSFASHTIFLNRHRPDVLIENLIFGGGFFMVFVKVLSVYLIRKRLGRALQILQNDVLVPNITIEEGQEEKLVAKCMMYANGQGIAFCALAFTYGIAANMEILRRRITYSDPSDWILPFGDISLFNWAYTPTYEIIYAYQNASTFIAWVGYGATNIITVAVMTFLSFQCNILQKFIKTLTNRISQHHFYGDLSSRPSSLMPLSHVEWKYLQKTLREIVQFQTAIADVVKEFENLFYIPTLVDFFGISTLICLSLLYGTSMSTFNFRYLQMLLLALAPTVLQFMTSYWGNEVTVQYSAIGGACQEIDFVGTDIRFQKGICFVIQRSQKPVQFTVGKFAPLTLQTFLAVLKGSYSFYMLCHNLNIGITVEV